MMNRSSNFPRSVPFQKRSAFTLVEVTISVAMALVLMLGIAQVFRISGDAVGSGQALGDSLRDARAAQTILSHDLGSAVRDGSPFFIILNNQVFAYRNRADMLADKDQNVATADQDGSGVERTIVPTSYGLRSHRTDTFNFFARGFFDRQTGATEASSGASPFIAPMSGNEAWIWYGHEKQMNDAGTFSTAGNTSPGGGTISGGTATTSNQHNFFADDWLVGRQQTILSKTTTIAPNGAVVAPAAIVDLNGAAQYAYCKQSGSGAGLSPLSFSSIAYKSSSPTSANKLVSLADGTTTFTLQSGRLDVALTSINDYYNLMYSYIPSNTYPPTNPLWSTQNFFATNNVRYWAQPSIQTRPITPENLAASTGVLVRGCTQFIVEYAGDYLYQDATMPNAPATDWYIHLTEGAGTLNTPPVISAAAPGSTDGVIDYIQPVVGGARKIRWYGMPRSTSGNVAINATNGDVVPLRDLIPGNGTQAPFEVTVPTLTKSSDYSGLVTVGNSMAAGVRYTCAFGPTDPKPKMIRITMVIDDPQGRLGDGQTYEYIFTLP